MGCASSTSARQNVATASEAQAMPMPGRGMLQPAFQVPALDTTKNVTPPTAAAPLPSSRPVVQRPAGPLPPLRRLPPPRIALEHLTVPGGLSTSDSDGEGDHNNEAKPAFLQRDAPLVQGRSGVAASTPPRSSIVLADDPGLSLALSNERSSPAAPEAYTPPSNGSLPPVLVAAKRSRRSVVGRSVSDSAASLPPRMQDKMWGDTPGHPSSALHVPSGDKSRDEHDGSE